MNCVYRRSLEGCWSQCPTLGRSYKSGTAASREITLIKASSGTGTLTNLTKLNESADRCFAVSSHWSHAAKTIQIKCILAVLLPTFFYKNVGKI